MGKMGKVPVFPIFLSVFARKIALFFISLQLKTNYFQKYY